MNQSVECVNDPNIVAAIKAELQLLGVSDKLVSASERLCVSTPLGPEDFLKELQDKFGHSGIETCIRNALVSAKRRAESKEEPEPLAYMRKAQSHFEKRVNKALMALHADSKLCLVRQRSSIQIQQLSSKWNELSTYDQDMSLIRGLYSTKDLFDAATSVRDPDYPTSRLEEMWNSIKVPLSVSTFEELRALFKDIYVTEEPYLGIGPSELVLKVNNNVTLLSRRIALASKVGAENDILLSEEFVKGGCPPQSRAHLWKQVLQAHVSDQERAYFEARRQSVIQTEYLTDKVIIKDIQLTVSRDEHYFVFEDLVYQVALCFSRDPYVYSQSFSKLGMKSISRHISNQIPGPTSTCPPSSCIPFSGWSMYVAPLCYVHENVEDIYFTLRSMYLKYWYRLHRISSHPQGLVALSSLFERLLQRQEPDLWMHCLNQNIQPLKLALPWLVQAFSGFLIPEQLLYVWDLILGFDTLNVLPLLAAAIFSLRRDNLRRVETQEAADAICRDLSTIKVIPLLQMALAQHDHYVPPTAS